MNMLCIILLVACVLGSTASILSTDPSYPSSVLAIQAAINRYPPSIDLKKYEGLAKVFTQDAVFDLSADNLGVWTGLPAIQGNLSVVLAPLRSQHSLSTQVIDVLVNDRANVTTYFTAKHWGSNNRVHTGYGLYEDVVVNTDAGWRICYRNLVFMGPADGNLTLGDPSTTTST